jgi:imidazolonepropionase-like amidohydrolase
MVGATALCPANSIAQRGGRGRGVQRPTSMLITDVTVIDGTGAPPKAHMSILIDSGRFTRVFEVREPVPKADTVVDGTGLFAIPGLIDAHVHIGTQPWAREVDQLQRALRGGITAVVDLAGDTRANGNLSRAVLAGEIQGPSVYYSALMAGPSFFSDARVQAASIGYKQGTAPWMQAMTDTTDVVQAVARAKGTGAVAIKLYAAMDSALVARIITEAKRQHMQTFAHATVFPAKPSDMVRAGLTMLVHAPYLVWEGMARSDSFTIRGQGDFTHVPVDAPAIEHLLALMKAHGTLFNPTVWVFSQGQPGSIATTLREPWLYAVTKRASDLGIPIVAGTDGLFGDPRDSLPTLHEELRLLVTRGGLTPLQAITAATLNGARAIGIDKTYGTIQAGKTADLLLLQGNPADSITNTRRIQVVVKNGLVVGGR